MSEVRDKDGVPIHVGDYVKTKNRHGQVQAIFSDNTSAPAEKADDTEITVAVKHPPKVVLLDKKGIQFSHSPSVLSHARLDHEPATSDLDTSGKVERSGRNGGKNHPEGASEVQDKSGIPIHVGQTVMTRYRGGTREGEVEAIFTNSTASPAEEEPGHDVHIAVTNPPKVVFTTQRDKQVAHNPSTLSHVG